jgi:xanthine dehydrogenase small subunit
MRTVASTASAPLEFVLNGRPVPIGSVATGTTLLDFLRGHGLTGAKEGCAEGECGTCTVVTVGQVDGRTAYRAVNSCLVLLPTIAGHEVYTVESLAFADGMSEVQRALANGGASQCGFCTPGFVMSLFAEQYRPGREGPCDPSALGGNLCRCTGYRPIRDAAFAIGAPSPGPFRDRLAARPPVLAPIATEHFSRPSTVEEALSILADDPAASLVAGGSDLGVESNLRSRRFADLVSVEAIAELRAVVETDAAVTLGAALPLADIAWRWRGAPAVLHDWLELFASPPIRNRATLGGNLATASPIGDAAPLLTALDAVVHVAGVGGRRKVPLSSFFRAYRQTAMEPGEIIAAVEIPKPLPRFVRFYKVAKRRLDDISTVAAGMAVDVDAAGRVMRSRFAFGGVAPTPVRLTEAEDAIRDRPWNEAAVRRVQDVIDRTLTPMSDHRGSKEYRLAVARALVEKFWWERRQPGRTDGEEDRRA